jgi:hypothetical protein
MSDQPARQEVVVTDIRMRFGSMIVFMIKWTIAAIPAVFVLIVLAAFFWSSVIGLFHSTGGKAGNTAQSNTPSSIAAEVVKQDPAVRDYLSTMVLRNIKVGTSVLGDQGVYGEVKNNGARTLRKVEITVYCLDATGKPVFEKTFHPVLVSDFSIGDNQPLKPGYSRQFGFKLDDAPSDWSKKVDVKVTNVEFQ